MMNAEGIQLTLGRMADLLRIGGVADWATALERMKNEIFVDPEGATNEILRMYGGMGSLNDIVLYKDGQPLLKENVELDRLRAKLFELCCRSL